MNLCRYIKLLKLKTLILVLPRPTQSNKITIFGSVFLYFGSSNNKYSDTKFLIFFFFQHGMLWLVNAKSDDGPCKLHMGQPFTTSISWTSPYPSKAHHSSLHFSLILNPQSQSEGFRFSISPDEEEEEQSCFSRNNRSNPVTKFSISYFLLCLF